jgi:hypothetical protein
MRYVIGVVLALSVGIGAYLGSVQVADSAKTPPRKVTLRLGDIAAIGHMQCRAEQDGRGHHLIISDAFFACSKGPSSPAQWVQVRPGAVRDFKKVGQVQCDLEARSGRPTFSTPALLSGRHPIFYASLWCWKGPGNHAAALSVEVLPGGIAVVNRWGKMVHMTRWNG